MNESDEGKKLYDEYIKSYKAWIQYIEMKIIYKQSEFLTKNNKKYYKYDYLSMYDNITSLNSEKSLTESTQCAESKLKYKKLSLLFHPDKFINNIINLKSVENKNYWNLINTTNEIIEDKYTVLI